MEPGSLVYLDTNAVLFLYAGLTERISPAAKQAIDAGSLRISPMVLLEIQYLREVGKFKHRPDDVIAQLGKQIGLAVCNAAFAEVTLTATRMEWTRDPFDRMITAHASCQQAPLVSADQNIRANYERAIW